MATKDHIDDEIRPRKLAPKSLGDEVVISGIAGRFPSSNNLHELRENLFTKGDLIADGHRWKPEEPTEHPTMPIRTGKVNNIEKFDALFFGISPKQVNSMDPQVRMLLEHSYEAILDAGINPGQLRGGKTAIFAGVYTNETELSQMYNKTEGGYGLAGCLRTMLSNRISYQLGLTGPSFTLDTGCSSTSYAMEQAYRAINDGVCDDAIVISSNLCLHPIVSAQYYSLGLLAKDGRCKTFDDSSDGYVRSEAAGAVYLQKFKNAKRVYSTLVHAKVNADGYKEEGIFFPSSHMQSILLKEFYLECGLPPSIVSYVEAHGTGTRVGDVAESNALDLSLCSDRSRKGPLLIGSVKTNVGHTEASSGLVCIAKVITVMETGQIPPNLYFNQCRQGISGLLEGRLKVVTERTPWTGDYIGINSFGIGGTNSHLLLKTNGKKKVNGGAPTDDLPRLVVVSGRTEGAVSVLLRDVESKPLDVEYVALLHNIHKHEINGNFYRGYTVLPARGILDVPVREIVSSPQFKRPIWFVFSGMGSQWPGMGEALLSIPVFAEAIKKCDVVLKPHGIDIFHIITTREKSVFDLILHSFVGIAAIQIGLVDVLFSIGIKPDYIIGHSVGELGCAYADGCLTAEQMILSVYFRGLASVEAKVIKGSMAAIGLGYKEVINMCPPDIDVACHNSSESATISGPAESVNNFVAELTAKNIFAKEVACSNIPYHSRYIAGAGPKFLGYLKKVIPSPKIRSSKWTSELIPKDAVTIEIAPHGLLQAILKRSLNPSVTNISLAQRAHKDNVEVFLQAVGKMFNEGLQPQISNLYPAVEFPVSRKTPMISPLIKWDHSDDWFVPEYEAQNTGSGERVVDISLSNREYANWADHVIDGRNLFPATAYLTLVWETFALMRGEVYTELSVVFEDVKFLRATVLRKDKIFTLTIVIHKRTERFEVVEGESVLVTGSIRSTTKPKEEKLTPKSAPKIEEEPMRSKDVYKELRLRGYQYAGNFRSITRASTSGLRGHIAWRDDWVTFIDNILQMRIVAVDSRGLFVPTSIKKLVIDTNVLYSQIENEETEKEFEVTYNKLHDVIDCGGVQVLGLKATAILRRQPAGEPVIEEYKFIPSTDGADVSLRDIVILSTHIALENHPLDIKVKTVELRDDADKVSFDDLLSPLICECLENLPLIQANTIIVSNDNMDFENETLSENIFVRNPKELGKDTNALLVVGHQLLTNERVSNLNLLLDELKPGGFLITREKCIKNYNDVAQSKGFHIILIKKCGKEFFVLLKKRELPQQHRDVIKVNNEEFIWLSTVRQVLMQKLEKDNARIILVAQGDFENGLMGLVNCLRREPGGKSIQAIFIQDPKATPFSLQNPLYAEQLKKDLAISVLRDNGVWGTYRHLPLTTMVPKPVKHMYVKQLVPGDLSSLTWIEGPIDPQLNKNNLAYIVYASVNFKDIMLASGKLITESITASRLAQDGALGFEVSGVDNSGKRIMGMLKNRGFSNLAILDQSLTWEVPKNWSLEDAATVPCVYGTCLYALYMKGKMKKGDKVLIHAGAGGIGQAAINLALAQGCEVFTTVGTPEKRQFIRQHFPEIPDDHIGNSRDTSFEQMIKEQTDGYGVDIVLNSLAEKKLLASVRCLAWGGQFLEIGKFDLEVNNSLGMECFLREIGFNGVMLDHMFDEPVEKQLEWKKLVDSHLKNGTIKPLVRTVFTEDKVQEAFRYMAAGKHIGKVLIKVRNETNPTSAVAIAVPKYYCSENRTYIILGGLGGLGLELADWMVLRGAKNLILTSRNGIKNGYQRQRIELWESYGVKVVIVTGKDASSRKDCQYILETATQIAPIDGIFNLAVVLKDALFENQNAESFEESFKSKAWATKNLDILTRKLCPQLRHFVVFSSVSCGRGNAGQSNYGMSNSVMERICEKRVSEGLPGLAIQWGAIGDVGLVADMQEDNKELVIGGTLQQRISSCLQVLDDFLQQSRPVVSSMVVAEKRIGKDGSLNIVQTVQSAMGVVDLKRININTPLTELGMDSIVAMEIKQTLERDFELFLNAEDMCTLSFAKLQQVEEERESNKKKKFNESTNVVADILFTNIESIMRLIGNPEHIREKYLKLCTKEETSRNEIFFIPGIEGLAAVFDELTTKIKTPATCLQLGACTSDSISGIADDLFPYVFEKSRDRGSFEIVGYSFGALIALELVSRLEAKGLNGKLILIDGAPRQLKNFFTPGVTVNNSDDLQNICISTLIGTKDSSLSKKYAADLEKCKTWQEKVQIVAKVYPIPGRNVAIEDYDIFCTAMCKKMYALISYDPSRLKAIEAHTTLLKPVTPSYNTDVEDYGLSEIIKHPVKIHYARGNHLTMLSDEKVALAINGELNDN